LIINFDKKLGDIFMKNYGIVSRSYGNMTVAEAAKFMVAHGYNCTELCMAHPDFGGWVYNGVS